MDAETIVPVRDVAGRFPPGVSGNPSGRSPGLPRELKERLAVGAPAAVDRLIELVGSDDERVALAATIALLDRLYGRPHVAVDATVTKQTEIGQAHLKALLELATESKARKAEREREDAVVINVPAAE